MKSTLLFLFFSSRLTAKSRKTYNNSNNKTQSSIVKNVVEPMTRQVSNLQSSVHQSSNCSMFENQTKLKAWTEKQNVSENNHETPSLHFLSRFLFLLYNPLHSRNQKIKTKTHSHQIQSESQQQHKNPYTLLRQDPIAIFLSLCFVRV